MHEAAIFNLSPPYLKVFKLSKTLYLLIINKIEKLYNIAFNLKFFNLLIIFNLAKVNPVIAFGKAFRKSSKSQASMWI